MTHSQINLLKEARSSKRSRTSYEAYAQMEAAKQAALLTEHRAQEIVQQRFSGIFCESGQNKRG